MFRLIFFKYENFSLLFFDIFVLGESCHIQLDLCIDKTTAPAMNLGTKKIEDILVLHLKGGKDFFVSFKKFYLSSCYGDYFIYSYLYYYYYYY